MSDEKPILIPVVSACSSGGPDIFDWGSREYLEEVCSRQYTEIKELVSKLHVATERAKLLTDSFRILNQQIPPSTPALVVAREALRTYCLAEDCPECGGVDGTRAKEALKLLEEISP
jgi:hypothetical protein